MFEPEFIETATRTGSDWSAMRDVLLPIVVSLIVACLSWLFGWTGRERRQDRDNIAIRDGIYVYVLHFSTAARSAFPDPAIPARRLVDAIESQLGPLLIVCSGVSGRAKAIREVLDLSKPLSPAKAATPKPSSPKVALEEAQILVPGSDCTPAEVREGFLIKTDTCPPPPKEAELARDRRARLLEAVDDFHVYWSDRASRTAELAAVQRKLTETRPPAISSHGAGSHGKASHGGH
jgi:hypothetical protein